MQKMLPVLFIFLISCKERATISKTQTSLKDSIVNEFLALTDSLEFYDTTEHNFKILKAYFKNDTGFFRQMQKDIEFEKKYASEDTYFDSCFQLKKLSDLNVDEAYRFHHSQSFCFYNQIVTITRQGGLISLYYIETSGSPDGRVIKLQTKNGEKNIGPGCKIEKQFFKNLTIKEWEILEGNVAMADYWGLKPHNPRLGLDGSSWQIDAYTKQPKYNTGQKTHSVYRWSPYNSFAELGRIFMKLSGEKDLCGGF